MQALQFVRSSCVAAISLSVSQPRADKPILPSAVGNVIYDWKWTEINGLESERLHFNTQRFKKSAIINRRSARGFL